MTDLQRLRAQWQRLRAVLASAYTTTRLQLVATKALEAEHKDRVFVQGRATNGSRIGTYSTRPIYASPQRLAGLPTARIRPQGKSGARRFKSGHPRRSRYFAGGYRELRRTVGRQSQYVDLNLTGTTLSQLVVGRSNGRRVSYGFSAMRPLHILEGHEAKYRKVIITPSRRERITAVNAARKEIQHIIRHER